MGSDTVSYSVEGLKELEKLLESFPGKLGTTVVRRALADAARLGRNALKAEAQKHNDRGTIRVNLRTNKERTRHLSDTAIIVQRRYDGTQYIAVGFSYPQGAAGWIVEHGHRIVTGGTIARIRSGNAPKSRTPGLTGVGRVLGFVRPHPIAAPAFEEVRPAMEETFMGRVQSEAEKEFTL